MTIFKKKATDTQETKKLPMTGKVKKGFRAYCTMVIVGALALGMTTTAFAANDPLTVVNNLSDFIFGLIRAIGMILALVSCRSVFHSNLTTLLREPMVS